jgi:hypothetical protein
VGRQHGPTALIDDAQPTDALAGAEADQFGGVHLPDVVGVVGPRGVAAGPPPFGGGPEAGLV